MVLAWRTWCGLCGAVPSTPFLDLRVDKALLDVAIRCFLLTLERNAELPVCPECLQFVTEIKRFTDSCHLARDMLTELKRTHQLKTDEEFLAFRESFLENATTTPQIKSETVEVKLEELPEDSLEEDDNTYPLLDVDDEDDEDDDDNQEDNNDQDDHHYESSSSSSSETPKTRKPRKSRGKADPKTKQCDECQIIFKFKYELHEHNEKKHPGKEPWPCKECNKSFRSSNHLQKHTKRHQQPTTFQCTVCPKVFKRPGRLEAHVQTHSQQREKWVCPQCGVVLNTRHTFSRHMKVHSDERRHKCQICAKLFKRHKTLKDHLIIHSGLRPYKCPFCERTFVNGANCRSHKRKNHPEQVAALEASGMNEAVLKECRNIPRMDELIAVSLQRLGAEGGMGGGCEDGEMQMKVRTSAGRPPHDAWEGFSRKWCEGSKRYLAECERCHEVCSTAKHKMQQHRCFAAPEAMAFDGGSTEIGGSG